MTTGAASETTTPVEHRGWRLLRRALLEQRRGIAFGVAASLVWTAARVAVPRLVQLAIDRSITGDERAWPYAVAVAVAGAVSGVFLGIRRYVAFDNARRVEARYRSRLFAHLQRLHVAFHDVTATGELMSRANTDLQMFQNVVTMVPITVGNALIVLGAVAIMLTISPMLTIVAVAGLPIVNVVGRRFSQKLHPAVMGVQRESAELAGVVEETVSGIRAVKGFGAEDVQRAKLATEADDVRREALRAAHVRARYLPLVELMPNLGLVAVLAYGGWLVIDGGLSVGELVGFNLYVAMLIQPLRMLGMVIAQGQRAVAAGERIAEVLDTDPAITDPARPVALPAHRPGQTGGLRFDGVVFGYRTDAHDPAAPPVLEELDLEIAPGESVALVGPTGCGKSTVARLLPRFYDVEAGSIELDGIDLRHLRLADLRRAVGLVFQETFLFSGSIRDNIGFADPDAPDERIRRAARLAGALDFIEALPAGFDTELGERGLSLSGGQRQRLAIARALVADPRVLLLDDATSAVDPDTEHEIREAMNEVMAGRTTIVIAHRPATIALADRVVVLDEGRIVATGTHAELLASNERYRAILATEAVA
ncbi:MAG: ABC transporter ATP-binding protein [Acidimicrobiales bacterium]